MHYYNLYGGIAKWEGKGLQNLDRRFESGYHLHYD